MLNCAYFTCIYYNTYEEARQMLNAIRKLGISGASIVKGKITVSNL